MPIPSAVQQVASVLPWFWPLVGAVLGGVLGSFGGCASYRLRHGLSLRSPPSFCPACKQTLTVPDLIPAASWLVFGGKCRRCRAPIGLSTLVWDAAGIATGGFLGWLMQRLLA